jgi:cation transport regulator ChaC
MIRVFAYGSLMYQPTHPPTRMLSATLPGHRRRMNMVSHNRGIHRGEGPHPLPVPVDGRIHGVEFVTDTRFRSLCMGTERNDASAIHGMLLEYATGENEVLASLDLREIGEVASTGTRAPRGTVPGYARVRVDVETGEGRRSAWTYLTRSDSPRRVPSTFPDDARILVLVNATPFHDHADYPRGLHYAEHTVRSLRAMGRSDKDLEALVARAAERIRPWRQS